MRLKSVLAFAAFISMASSASAQDRPFVFTLSTMHEAASPRVRVDYDIGTGEFRPDSASGPEHRLGVQASIGRWTLLGRFGMAPAGESYASSQQGEVLYSFTAPAATGFSLAAGGGLLHEAAGIDVLLARISAGHETASWRLHGNALLQKPLQEGRDNIDLITSVGWARKLRPSLALGLEAIGDDLEGFWTAAESEGGARLLVGPSMHFTPESKKWQVSVAGGPMFFRRNSALASGAERDLPPITTSTSYALRLSFSAGF